jgi:hypothetical protein
MTALGVLLLGVGLWDFRLGQEFEFLRVECLVAEIVAGAGMAFCFGGAMHYLDLALGTVGGRVPAWYWRALFVTQKRVLLVGQLGAAAIVVAALGAVIFEEKIPGPDRSVLERGWAPVATPTAVSTPISVPVMPLVLPPSATRSSTRGSPGTSTSPATINLEVAPATRVLPTTTATRP